MQPGRQRRGRGPASVSAMPPAPISQVIRHNGRSSPIVPAKARLTSSAAPGRGSQERAPRPSRAESHACKVGRKASVRPRIPSNRSTASDGASVPHPPTNRLRGYQVAGPPESRDQPQQQPQIAIEREQPGNVARPGHDLQAFARSAASSAGPLPAAGHKGGSRQRTAAQPCGIADLGERPARPSWIVLDIGASGSATNAPSRAKAAGGATSCTRSGSSTSSRPRPGSGARVGLSAGRPARRRAGPKPRRRTTRGVRCRRGSPRQ